MIEDRIDYDFIIKSSKEKIDKKYPELFQIISEPYLNEVEELEMEFESKQKNGENLDLLRDEMSQKIETLLNEAQINFTNLCHLKNLKKWDELLEYLVNEFNVEEGRAYGILNELKELREYENKYYGYSVIKGSLDWKEVPLVFLTGSIVTYKDFPIKRDLKRSINKAMNEYNLDDSIARFTYNELCEGELKSEIERQARR